MRGVREGEAGSERQLDTSGQALMTVMVEFPCESAVGGCGLLLFLSLLVLGLPRIRRTRSGAWVARLLFSLIYFYLLIYCLFIFRYGTDVETNVIVILI